MIKILVADDHAIVREGLKRIVDHSPDIVVKDEASNGQEVLDKVSKNDYDVVVLDITLPDTNGLYILGELKSERPDLPVLVLSMHPEEQYAVPVLKAGASGYLTKESAPGELVAAIRKVSTGGRYVSSTLAEKMAFDLQTGAEGPLHQCLSHREFQVMRMITTGKTSEQICKELFLSPKTVSTYRSRILKKMRMKTNAELIRYCIQNRLFD